MPSTLKLQIVTPDGVAYSQEVAIVTLPGIEGQIGILPGHTKLMTQMVSGEIMVRKDGRANFIAVGSGLIEVTGGGVSILTDMAVEVDKIDEAKVE
ncbi:MAG: ATP synthase F1 subunit epsilon, partial [Blastocatellia bacterium]